MFFRSAEIEEDLKCAYCRQNFTDVVKLIPSCGESICGDCYEELKDDVDEENKFKCKACDKSHKLPEDGLPDNRSLIRMLKRSKIEKPLSKEAKDLKKLVDSLPNRLVEIESFDDQTYVHQYCDQLEVEITEEIESLIKILNDAKEDLLKQASEYRKQCLDSLSAKSSTQSSVRKEIQAFSVVIVEFNRNWNEFFNQSEAYESEKEIKAALNLAREFEERMDAFNRQLKRNALNGRFMTLKIARSSSGDQSSSKSHFCLSIQDDETKESKIELIPLHTLSGHSGAVNQVIFLSDDKLASCSEDKTISVWNVDDGVLLYKLIGHTHYVNSLAILTNGLLASGSDDMSIKLWDLSTRKVVGALKGHTGPIVSLRVLQNGNLASYSVDNTIRIWNPFASENNLLLTIRGHGNTEWLIPFGVLSDGNLVTISRDNDGKEKCVLRVWNSQDGKIVKAVSTGQNAGRTMLILSNDQVAVGFDDGTIKIIDLADISKSLTKMVIDNEGITALFELPDGNLICSGRNSVENSQYAPMVKFLRRASLDTVLTVKSCHLDEISSVTYSPKDKLVATGSRDHKIRLWSAI